jgi:hypothetical protein
MAEYIAPHPDVEVLGLYLFSIAYGMKHGTEKRLEILSKYGISTPQADEWYKVQDTLNAIKEIGEHFGEINLQLMGKTIALEQPLPPIPNLKYGFEFINPSTLSNHRLHGRPLLDLTTGEKYCPEAIGETEILEYSEEKCFAVVRRNSPYPVANMIGWFTGFVERFSPNSVSNIQVREDITKERQSKGGETSTILINW